MSTHTPVRAWIGLGSNLDDPAAQVRRALGALDAIDGTRVLRHSRLYRTPPWGRIDQPDFVNAVAELRTVLPAIFLLDALQSIEADAGRARVEHWGPRILDLDLLLYADLRHLSPQLQLPHPQIASRAFVLRPLAELEPELHVPGAGRVADLLAAVDCAGIEALG